MSEEKPKVLGLVELHEGEDGAWRVDRHGAACPRTREVQEALARGETPPHPRAPEAAPCKGPAKVASPAYRSGYDAINWSGKRPTVGQA